MSSLQWILSGSPLLSILLVVLTVSPNKQYRGILTPTTPAQQGPQNKNVKNFQEIFFSTFHDTCVETNPDLQFDIWFMFDDKCVDSLEDTEGHPGNLPGVVGSISDRKTRHHHVGIAYRLHLNIKYFRSGHFVLIVLRF